MAPESGKAKWEAAGRPLFGRLWSYEEVRSFKRSKEPAPHAHLETPDGWPSGCKVDPGPWVPWLPERWMQGIATTNGGKKTKCYISPDKNRYWHKTKIEQILGFKLESKLSKEVKETELKYVTDEDAVPSNWPDVVPHNWRIAFRQLPGRLHKIFVPSGQEDGFCHSGSN